MWSQRGNVNLTCELVDIGMLGSYDIFYAEDFNPHTRKRKTFRTNIPKSMLAEELLKLTKKYYGELTGEKKKLRFKVKKVEKTEETKAIHYRCGDCWTIFDENTEGSFLDTTDYHCPVCEADTSVFETMHAFEEKHTTNT